MLDICVNTDEEENTLPFVPVLYVKRTLEYIVLTLVEFKTLDDNALILLFVVIDIKREEDFHTLIIVFFTIKDTKKIRFFFAPKAPPQMIKLKNRFGTFKA